MGVAEAIALKDGTRKPKDTNCPADWIAVIEIASISGPLPSNWRHISPPATCTLSPRGNTL